MLQNTLTEECVIMKILTYHVNGMSTRQERCKGPMVVLWDMDKFIRIIHYLTINLKCALKLEKLEYACS